MKIVSSIKSIYAQALMLFVSAFYLTPAMAVGSFDTGMDRSGGKSLGDVADNLDTTLKQAATVLESFLTIGGFMVIGISLYQLYKASKDEREKPGSAIVGLVIGGLMAGAGTVMWMVRNTVLG